MVKKSLRRAGGGCGRSPSCSCMGVTAPYPLLSKTQNLAKFELQKPKSTFWLFPKICLKSQKLLFGFLDKTQKVDTENPKSKPKSVCVDTLMESKVKELARIKVPSQESFALSCVTHDTPMTIFFFR